MKFSETKSKQFKHEITQNLSQTYPPASSKLESKPGFELRFQQGFDWLKTEFELQFTETEVSITPKEGFDSQKPGFSQN